MKIEKLDYEGRGITHQNGKVCFVKNALPNEEIEATLVKETKRFSVYETTKIVKESKMRKSSFCPYRALCGGCTFDIVSYENSLKLKKEMLTDLFKQNQIIFEEFEIEKSPKDLGYRNKISLKIQNGAFGYFKEETHAFVKIQNCFLADDSIQNFLKDFSLLHVKEGNLTIKVNTNKELLLIIESKEKPKIEKSLIEKHKIAGIIWNQKCVYNSPFLFIRINHLLYKVHAESFFQVNYAIASKISEEILKYFRKDDTVFDLYCGVGYFSLQIASKVKQVLGIELNQKAIINANYNASLNQISNVSFHVGKVEETLRKIPIKASKVIVDPPRSGLHKEVIKVLKEKRPEKIIYISCNPKTLVRDILALKDIYKIEKIKAYDMFPYTKHVECVCVLEFDKPL